MASIEYAAFASRRLDLRSFSNNRFDYFLSAFNLSERVRTLYDNIQAKNKHWLIHDEYGLSCGQMPPEPYYFPDRWLSAPEYWRRVLRSLFPEPIDPSSRVAIDITGLMRPHLLLLPFMFRSIGLTNLTLFYSDPVAYVSGDRTVFAEGPVVQVSIVPGMGGSPSNLPSPSDTLIIGAGYDHDLIAAVAEQKPNAEHYVLFGLPSLQPHMYQESVLRVDKASESLSPPGLSARLFAPAHDPFATAQVLSDHVSLLKESARGSHIYLSPLGTKSQVLGFAWYYWCEGVNLGCSLIFPYSRGYSSETSRGIAAIHEFVLELDAIIA